MIYGQEIKASIARSASECEAHCYVATAYCKKTAFEELFATPALQAKVKILLLRWDLVDLVTGASDSEVYPLAKSLGWEVYIHQKLHAKVYRFDRYCYIGSANLTNAGMTGYTSTSNFEAVTKVDVTDKIENWFFQLVQSSRHLDDELYEHIKTDVEKYIDKFPETDHIDYSLQTQKLLKATQLEDIYTNDFFWSANPDAFFTKEEEGYNTEHDLYLLRLNSPISQQELSAAFHHSKAFRWLINILIDKKEIYFGELTALLHESLCDDPEPYRKTVKILLNNLINWAGKFSKDIILIDQPNRSTRLRLQSSVTY